MNEFIVHNTVCSGPGQDSTEEIISASRSRPENLSDPFNPPSCDINETLLAI